MELLSLIGSKTMNNKRFVAFYTTKGRLVYKFFKEGEGIENSHRALKEALENELASSEGNHEYLDYYSRYCGFYADLYGNGSTFHRVFYGESSDYPHIDELEAETLKSKGREYTLSIEVAKALLNVFKDMKPILIYEDFFGYEVFDE